MPNGDIMPFKSPLGGTTEVRVAGMTASQTFLLGQPVGVVDAGTVTAVSNVEGTAWTLASQDTGYLGGISCFAVGGDDGDGTTSSVGAPINPKTGAVFTTNDEVAFWPFNQGTLFITRNFHDTAATAAVVPAVTDIGEAYTISPSHTAAAGLGWGLAQTGPTFATDVHAMVVDVLDAQRAPIRISGGTGVSLVFEINAHRTA